MAGRLVTSTCISIKSRSSKGSMALKSAKKSKPSQFGKSREVANAVIAKGIDFDAAKDNTTPAEIRSKAKILSPLKMASFANTKEMATTDFSTGE